MMVRQTAAYFVEAIEFKSLMIAYAQLMVIMSLIPLISTAKRVIPYANLVLDLPLMIAFHVSLIIPLIFTYLILNACLVAL